MAKIYLLYGVIILESLVKYNINVKGINIILFDDYI